MVTLCGPQSKHARALGLGFALSALAFVFTVQVKPDMSSSFTAQTVATNVYTAEQTAVGVLIEANKHNIVSTAGNGTFGPLGPVLAASTDRFWGYEYVGTEPPFTGKFLISAGEKSANPSAPASTLTQFTRGKTMYFMTQKSLVFKDNLGLEERYQCGNGVKEGEQIIAAVNNHVAEICDDGNAVNNDACSNECKIPDYDAAECVTFNPPAEVLTAETFTVPVTFRNTGSRTWKTGTYKVTGIAPWTPTEVLLPADVPPYIPNGASGLVTIPITVTAPATAAVNKPFAWTLSLGSSPIAVACSKPVTIKARENNAEVTIVSAPDAAGAGKTFSVKFRVKNTGTKFWKKENYALKTTDSNTLNWTVNSYALPKDIVAPGETVDIDATLTAPAVAATVTKTLSVRMVQVLPAPAVVFGPAATKPIAINVCGNAKFESATEACDDGNSVQSDGCTNACTVQPGFTCTPDGTGKSVCSAIIPTYP